MKDRLVADKVTVLSDLWHNPLWQWFKEGCCKPLLGVWGFHREREGPGLGPSGLK